MIGIGRFRTSHKTTQPQSLTGTPLADVRASLRNGAVSRRDIAERTGLTRDTVDAVIAHLERSGELHREHLGSSCPGGGCASCGFATAQGHACTTSAKGPVALVLGPIHSHT